MIHQNLNLLIKILDCNELSGVELLPNEIWAVILKYLNYVDILSIKLSSKRCFNISFLSSRFKYFRCLAKQLTDCNLYYQEINAFIDNFIEKIKNDISLPDWLYLNYFFDQLKGNLMLSSCFCHLFHCPRSFYVENNCQLCCRKFIPVMEFTIKDYDEILKFVTDKNAKYFLKVFFRILVNASYDFANILLYSQSLIFLQKFYDLIIVNIFNTIAKFDFSSIKI